MKVTRSLLLSNTFYSTGTSLLSQIVIFFIIPLFIKNLGEEMYGIWVISNIVLGYMGLFDFGFTQGIQRYIAFARAEEDHSKLNTVIATGMVILCLIGVVIASLLMIYRYPIVDFFNIQQENRDIAAQLLLISAMASLFQWPFRIFETILKAHLRVKEYSILRGSLEIVKSVILLLFVVLDVHILTMKVVDSFMIVLITFIPVFIIGKHFPEIIYRPLMFRYTEFRRMSGFSLGMFYQSLMNLFSVKIDNIIIGRMISMAAVSHYVIASKLYTTIASYSGKIMELLLPSVYNIEAQQEKTKLQKLLHQGVRYRTLFSCALAFPAIVYSTPFIRLWMGEQYEWIGIWSQVFCVLPVLSALGVATNMARAMGFTKQVNLIFTVKVALNIAISIFLVPYVGIGGAILGTIISNVVIGDLLLFPYFSKLIDCSWKKVVGDYLKIVGVYAMLSLVFFMIGRYWFTSVGALIISFLLMLVALYITTRYLLLNAQEKEDFTYVLGAIINKVKKQ